MSTDGSDVVLIASSDRERNHVHVSSNGLLVFSEYTKDLNNDGKVNEADIRSSEIGVMDIDGKNIKLLTSNEFIDAGPVWSPDGKQILFVSDRNSSPYILDLYIMDADDGNVRALTDTPGVIEADPHWVKDKIVFNRSSPPNYNFGIWIMNASGTNQTQLTNPFFPNKSSSAYAFGDYDPKISPDGTRIAFVRHQSDKGNFGVGDYDIYVMDIDGGNLTDISRNDEADLMPTWNPDGSKLAFWVISENLNDLGDIFVMNPDGTERKKVSQEPDSIIESQPDWLSVFKIIFSGELHEK